MSPAGSAAAQYRPSVRRGTYTASAALLGLIVAGVVLLSSGQPARAGTQPLVAAISPAWSAFQAACVAGPAPGQGNTGSACVCWEQHLEAVAIGPADAVDILTAAQIGQGAAYTVRENIGNEAVNNAMNGCGLYQQ